MGTFGSVAIARFGRVLIHTTQMGLFAAMDDFPGFLLFIIDSRLIFDISDLQGLEIPRIGNSKLLLFFDLQNNHSVRTDPIEAGLAGMNFALQYHLLLLFCTGRLVVVCDPGLERNPVAILFGGGTDNAHAGPRARRDSRVEL